MTVFGPVRAARLGYGALGRASLHPADAELNLPKEYYSYGVRRRVAEEAAKASFDEVVAAMEKTTGASLAKRQAEELALRAAQDFELFYNSRSQSREQPAQGSILVMSTDGKGIVMRKQDLRAQTRKAADKQSRKMQKRLSKGEKRNRKRMAQVAGVYTIEPHIRSAEDIAKEFRPASSLHAKPPKPHNKRVWASVEKSAEEVITTAFDEAVRRDPNQEKMWAVLVDGNLIQLDVIERKITQLNRTT